MEKIFKIDDHVAAAIAGLTADARVLIDNARVEAQVHILSYDEAISVQEVTRSICDFKQAYTMSGGARPFGVSLLIAGVDSSGPHLYVTDPSGAYFGYFCWAIGGGGQAARDFLEKEYEEAKTLDDLQVLALKSLKEVMEDQVETKNFEMLVITQDDPTFSLLSTDEKQALIDKL